jgi:hypothetical protein
MKRLRKCALGAAVVSLLLVPSGCESDNDEPLAYESRSIRGDVRHDVPAGTTLVKEGHEPMLFQTPSDGTIWVYNSSDNRLVYSGSVRAGQTVHVDADHDFVTVDGRKVMDMKMDDFDNHQILFGPTAVTAGSRTTAQPPSVTVQQEPSVTVQQEPAQVHVKPGEVEVEPARVKVVPAN